MKFGPVPVAEALGGVLAHSVRVESGRLRKGRVLTAEDITALTEADIAQVTIARLEDGDLPEDIAAHRLALRLCGAGLETRDPFTGRSNLHATGAGVLRVDRAAIDAVNAVDPAITVATLPEWQRVAPGTMAATVKIIPYGIPGAALETALAVADGALSVVPPRLDRADLIVTTLPGAPTKSQAVHDRLARLGLACTETQVPHDTQAIAGALATSDAPLRLILTASATSDAADVGPSGVIAAGGRLIRMGMPVDPGNLLFLADLCGTPVIGLPGCARSPALNGADWILERVICGIPVDDRDIAAMGVGGLLGEIPTRPQPRAGRTADAPGS